MPQAQEGGSTLTPAQVLQKLRENDEAFDNVALSYVREYDEIRKPRFSLGTAIEGGTFHFRLEQEMATRSSTIIFSSTSKPLPENAAAQNRESGFFVAASQRWGCVGDESREILAPGSSVAGDHENIVSINRDPDAASIIREQRMEVEFGHGIGFGKRIKTIESVKPAADGFKVTGSMQLFSTDVTRFEIIIDRDFVVRRANIAIDAAGNLTEFDIETKGLAKDSPIRMAASGRYKVTWAGRRVEGKIVGSREVTEDYSFEFLRIKVPLSKEEFEKKLDSLVIPTKSFVLDRVRNERYTIDGEGGRTVVESGYGLPAGRALNYSNLAIIVAISTALFCAGISVWWLYKKKAKSNAG